MPIYEPDPDISITIKPISEFIQPCVDLDEDRGREIQDYRKLLEDLKDYGKNPQLADYDSMTCGNTNGNISNEYTKVDGMNAIVYNKALYQEVGSLSTFYKQVIFVDQYDQVYEVVFNYDFGKLGEYLATMRGDGSEAYAYENIPENWKSGKIEEAWQEVIDYFQKGKPINNQNLKGFEDNEKVIDEMIKSIKIDPTKVVQSPSKSIGEAENNDLNQNTISNLEKEISPPIAEVENEKPATNDESFISIPESGQIVRSENNAFYINGKTSNNCEKITITAINSDTGRRNEYDLTEYKKGDTSFKYGIREDWDNIDFGLNSYFFMARCNDLFVSDQTTIYIPQENNFIPSNPANTLPNFWDGYQWASDNSVSSFDACQSKFGTGFSEDGCNEYVKKNYSGYNTFYSYDCTEDCSGHEAGYEWAEENDIQDTYDCEGNSDSFIEGCESYVEENY